MLSTLAIVNFLRRSKSSEFLARQMDPRSFYKKGIG